MQQVPCNKCCGTGAVDLPPPLRDTLAALRRSKGGLCLTDLHEALNRDQTISMSAVFYRVRDLLRFGLIEENERIYTVK